MTVEEIKIANATYRRNGSSVFDENGKIRSVVANYVAENIEKDKKILDFGCGSEFIQGRYLINLGFDVDGYDFGRNKPKECIKQFGPFYDVVYASNVLNVLSSSEALRETLLQIKSCLKNNSVFIANYPQSPRKLNLTAKQMENILRFYFGDHIKNVKCKSSTLWIVNFDVDVEKHKKFVI